MIIIIMLLNIIIQSLYNIYHTTVEKTKYSLNTFNKTLSLQIYLLLSLLNILKATWDPVYDSCYAGEVQVVGHGVHVINPCE